MLNKRVREGIRKIHKPSYRIRFCLGTLSVIALCVLLLIIATFTQIKISFNIPDMGISSYLKFEYIPQIPVVIFIAALLGGYWGLIAVLLYIIMGLTPAFPVFALGGGLSYIFQYNFGYIFGFIFAVIISSRTLKKHSRILRRMESNEVSESEEAAILLQAKNRKVFGTEQTDYAGSKINDSGFLDIIFAVLYGVFTIHIIGIIYSTIIALLRHDSFNFIGNMIYYQSISKILYDFVFGFIAVLIAKGLKKILWVFLG